ncbi:hypothetical protein OCQ_28010 [Mycobacterium paraintracellulare]|nr:hypothetical protein OCQ_28010 [Mycobacterium paraintracellulare]
MVIDAKFDGGQVGLLDQGRSSKFDPATPRMHHTTSLPGYELV